MSKNPIRYVALNSHGNDPDYIYGLHWLDVHRNNSKARSYTIDAWGNKPKAIRRMRRFYKLYNSYAKITFGL